MGYKPHPYFGTKAREALWQREELASYRRGLGRIVCCNLCGGEVRKFVDDFDESHDPAQPKVFGGKSTGIAHRPCNRLHGTQVVRPLVAKCDRVRKKHLGIKVPGLGRHPLPAGVRTPISRSMRGRVQPRLTLGQRLEALRARRSFADVDAPLAPEA